MIELIPYIVLNILSLQKIKSDIIIVSFILNIMSLHLLQLDVG